MKLKILLAALEKGTAVTLPAIDSSRQDEARFTTFTGIVNGLRRESGVGRGNCWLVTLVGNEGTWEIFVRVE